MDITGGVVALREQGYTLQEAREAVDEAYAPYVEADELEPTPTPKPPGR